MKKFKIMVVSLLIVFSSCNQDDIVINSTSDLVSASSSAKLSTSGNFTVYEVKPEIVGNFLHFCQTTATGIDGSKACGPTSYMMASYCLAKYINNNTLYTCSNTKLNQIVAVTGVSTYLSDLQNYGNNQDNSFIACSSLSSSDRTIVKTNMQNALATDKFVIAGVNMFGTSSRVNNSNLYLNSSVNPDLNPTSETTATYITTNKYGVYQKTSSCRGISLGTTTGVYGYIIVIVKITVNNIDGTGIVEYIDPIATSKPYGVSNRRYMSYTRLLESMKINGCYDAYDAISVGLK